MGEYVCDNCVNEPDIQVFIRDNAEFKKCDYCNRVSKDNSIAVYIEELADFIVEGFSTEFADPAEELPYESAEGGYQGTTYDTFDLLNEDAGVEDANLLDDLLQIIDLPYWAKKDWAALSESDQLSDDWDYFSEIVKYEMRYIFFRSQKRRENGDFINYPYEILDWISKLAVEFGLIKVVKTETEFFRVRFSNTKLTKVSELAPPKRDEALMFNRMSVAGIPIFYGSTDRDTALKEVYDKSKIHNNIASIARFKTMKDLSILDLTNLPSIPSMFDRDRREFRHAIIFLHSFVNEVVQPIKKDKEFHINYVPTQVFAEYIRYLFKFNEKVGLDGILYRSSRSDTGNNVALFINNDQCIDKKEPPKLKIMWDIPDPVLSLIQIKSISYP